MSNRLARVRRSDVVACMTCPLCSKLLREATTISLCLHTFCRKCIYEKLSDDECDTCPVCDINLGGDPVDKLRPDHNLQDIRAKIFPIKRSMADPPEATPSVPHPAKRKERSLSSLVVSAPRVSAQAGTTGRRRRVSMRKSSTPKSSSPSTEEHPSKEDLVEDDADETSSPETKNKVVKNKKLAHSSKSSNNQISTEDAGNSNVNRKVESWKPLNCLVEAANRNKFSKSNSLGPSQVKGVPDPAQDANTVEDGHRGEAQQAKRKRMRQPNRKAAAASGDSSNSPKLVVDGMRHNRQNVPIWFSLVASEDQEGAAPLPQISSGFLRIKNGDMPVSSIQKYVANKLELASADEVQIMCQGQAVLPSLQLRGLLETWLRNVSASRRVKTRVGSSGKDFVMVLTYSRKVTQVEGSAHQPPVLTSVQQPPIQASVQQPPIQASVQQPPPQAFVQQPPVKAPVQQPPVQQPCVEAPVQQPPIEASVQQPPVEASVQQPPVEASVQQPLVIKQQVRETAPIFP